MESVGEGKVQVWVHLWPKVATFSELCKGSVQLKPIADIQIVLGWQWNREWGTPP